MIINARRLWGTAYRTGSRGPSYNGHRKEGIYCVLLALLGAMALALFGYFLFTVAKLERADNFRPIQHFEEIFRRH